MATPTSRSAANLGKEVHGVEDDAVTYDSLAACAQDAAGNELEHEPLVTNDDGVAGVVAACVTRNGVEALAEHVDNFALAFIAPLGA